uniref:GAF domain-containing protein n=1 Tax=Phytophthora ramorum TaxID=164328 RepID=H3GZ69_PHYRM
MTRTQVEIRLMTPKHAAKKVGPPPSYQQAQGMPNAKLTPATVAPFPAFMRSRRSVDGSMRAGDDETESYADSFEAEDAEEENDDGEQENDDAEEETGGAPPDNESELAPSETSNAAENESENESEDVAVDASDYSNTVDEENSGQDTLVDDLSSRQPTARVKTTNRERERQTLMYYDQHTYTVISHLRAVNKRLSHQLEQQNKLVAHLTEEKKQHVQLIDSLRTESLEVYMTKLEKAEEERKELQQRHAHQLANYSHELSRLERLLEKAHVVVQEKDNELRLQRTRQLYCSTLTTPSGSTTAPHRKNSVTLAGGVSPNSTAGRRESLQVKNIFSDDIWKGLLPLPPVATNSSGDTNKDPPREANTVLTSSLAPLSFTSHVGQAFEQLLSHQLMALHDSTLDRSTRDWLREVMARSLQHVAESTHMYQLAEVLTEECRELMQAEQVLVLVVDKSQQEFWCRMPSRLAPENIAQEAKSTNSSKPQMSTVRSALSPLNYLAGSPSSISAAVPSRHPSNSVATDNADHLVMHPYASTLLVPILHDNRVLAVVQVCGKLTQVEALGLSIALERCDAFTPEDQALLTLVCHFSSGLFPKVAYFTDVESNKVNEETFIQLAPEIFTCLHFDELGKVVIENAKNILDADRCSLFVADNASRTLHNWHSDISGAGVEVYQRSEQKANTGMTIHFGQGIVGLVAETQQSINIPDAYDDPRFNSAWDQKTHYRTKSMLTVPIISNMGTPEKPGAATACSGKRGEEDKEKKSPAYPPREQTLLGVVQVINKSGGAPFRAKDEFLLQTISKLIALAIENSQLFQRNQELCWNVGKLISDGDLVEAIVSLGTAAEQIIGVEGAAVYVVDPDTHELVTFHHKRRYRIALSESTYAGSLMEDAVRSQQLTIVNDVGKASSFNPFVDSLSGIPARNVLFAPLLVDDSEGILSGMDRLSKSGGEDMFTTASGSGQKLVGLLQLVNSKGRKTHFDQHDLFLSIVQSQSCSVLAAILEKQRMLRQKEQIALLLDASMSFFKEMSVIGVINAVYNACVSIFDAETTAHLYLWEENENGHPVKDRERHMWTSKISPQAAASLAAHSSTTNMHLVATDARGATGMSFIPSLGAQSRKLSVVTDQTLRAPTSEGLFQQVLMRSSAVIVKHWIVDEEDGGPTAEGQRQDAVAAGSRSEQLSTLPILTRQISGALGVCHDLTTVSTRARKMQGMLELSRQSPVAAVSLTLTSRGHLGSFSQPVNVCSRGFSVRSLIAELHPIATSNLTVHSLYLGEDGHRWGFQLSGATAHEMSCEHFVQWIGKNVELPAGCTEAAVYGKLRMDLENVYTRKEVITGVIDSRQPQLEADEDSDSPGDNEVRVESTLSRSILLKLRQLLWEFTDAAWQVDVARASHALFGAFANYGSEDGVKAKKMLSRRELELALSTKSGGAGISLTLVEWDQLHACFADEATGFVDVEAMLTALRPQLKNFPSINDLSKALHTGRNDLCLLHTYSSSLATGSSANSSTTSSSEGVSVDSVGIASRSSTTSARGTTLALYTPVYDGSVSLVG